MKFIIKQIASASFSLILGLFINLLQILFRLVTWGSAEKDRNKREVCADSFDQLRVEEKTRYESTIDSQNRIIKPEYILFRNCPHCGSETYSHFFTTQDLFDYVKCRECGFLYSRQMLRNEARQFLYKDMVPSVVETCCTPEVVKTDAERFSFPIRRILKYHKGGNLLDLGCGVGNFLSIMKAKGFTVSGVEIYDDFRKIVKERFDIEVKSGLCEEVELPLNHYQVVTLWETLEHLKDPKAVLRRSFDILAPGGILALSVPNAENLGFLFLREYSGHRGCEHINFFSHSTISKMLLECGFTVLETYSTGGTPWNEIWKLLDLRLDTIYCYRNFGTQKEIAPTPFFSVKRDSFVTARLFSSILTVWEQKTGHGSGILILAQKRA